MTADLPPDPFLPDDPFEYFGGRRARFLTMEAMCAAKELRENADHRGQGGGDRPLSAQTIAVLRVLEIDGRSEGTRRAAAEVLREFGIAAPNL